MHKYLEVLLARALLLGHSKSGVTAIEYGMIAGLIAVVIIGAVTAIGTDVRDTFQAVSTALTPPAPAAGP